MLRIYLPSSMDLKLCADVPTVDFVNTWTFVTIFTSRHLGPNIWVLANGSKMICQPLGHLLGPGPRVLGLGPRTQYADLLQKKNQLYSMFLMTWRRTYDISQKLDKINSLKGR